MKVVHALPEEEWRRFVAAHPQGNVFHTPEMMRVFDRAVNQRADLWAVVEGGEVLALLPLVQVTLSRWLRGLTTRAIGYGGLLSVAGARGEEAVSLLLRTYTREAERAVLFTELRHLADTAALQPTLQRCGFAYEEHLDYLIDLARPPEEILQAIGRRTRKHIRRGLRRGRVRVAEVREREELGRWYALLRRTYRTAGVPLADRSLFEAAFDLLVGRRMARFTLAWVDEAAVACSVELMHKGTVYGWYGGVDRAYRALNPNELLTWEILKWGAEQGYRRYDFGGAGRPGERYGVRDFKAKFGGELVCYGRNVYVNAPRRLALSRLGYAVYRAAHRFAQAI